MFKNIRNNKGIALPTVFVVFVVLFVLSIALLQTSFADSQQATWQNNRIQAHYLARSGVYHGIELLDDKLSGSTPFSGTVVELADELQTEAGGEYTIADVGTYTLAFSFGTYSGEIKIISVGQTASNYVSTQVVTYTKELGTSFDFTNPASEWMTGVNLEKAINPSNSNESYLGHAVMLESKNSKHPIQSPKGSSSPSTFQASIIFLKDYQGRSLRQITNSIDLTFDGELIFFIGDIEFNKSSTPLYLSLSSEVLKQKTYEADSNYPQSVLEGVLDYGPSTAPEDGINLWAVGFEDFDRYKEFANTSDSSYYPPAGSFEPNTNYGVVKLGGGIVDSDETSILTVSDKGYYYFPDGFNLREAKGDLIKIDDDDPIVDVLDSLMGMSMGDKPPLWDNK